MGFIGVFKQEMGNLIWNLLILSDNIDEVKSQPKNFDLNKKNRNQISPISVLLPFFYNFY